LELIHHVIERALELVNNLPDMGHSGALNKFEVADVAGVIVVKTQCAYTIVCA
jgi:hypothetical protein